MGALGGPSAPLVSGVGEVEYSGLEEPKRPHHSFPFLLLSLARSCISGAEPGPGSGLCTYRCQNLPAEPHWHFPLQHHLPWPPAPDVVRLCSTPCISCPSPTRKLAPRAGTRRREQGWAYSRLPATSGGHGASLHGVSYPRATGDSRSQKQA